MQSAEAESTHPMKARKTLYHRDNSWGIHVGAEMREWVRAGPRLLSFCRELTKISESPSFLRALSYRVCLAGEARGGSIGSED